MSQYQSTFSGEVDIGPEDEAKQKLTEWLEAHKARVFWEKKNAFDHPTFRIENESEKPDLLVYFALQDIAVAVETKDGSSKSNIYNASPQLLNYWRKYAEDDQSYIVGSKQVDIDGFVTATQYSLEGHLFEPEVESPLHPSRYSSGRKYAIRKGELPELEYNMTEQHVRLMWRNAKKTDVSSPPAIGALLSTTLTGELSEPSPAVLWTLGNQQGWREFR